MDEFGTTPSFVLFLTDALGYWQSNAVGGRDRRQSAIPVLFREICGYLLYTMTRGAWCDPASRSWPKNADCEQCEDDQPDEGEQCNAPNAACPLAFHRLARINGR
jgi:hypothetical protein